MHLADFLREQLLLTGTHVGCEHGICGACTVEIDGEIARSCITYAVACEGASVRTIEGFDDDPLMARLRQAFTEEHALQCGYCTPGMLIAARDLIRRKHGLLRADIRAEMSGNLCRCTGYMGIVSAIERVMSQQEEAPSQEIKSWLGPAPGPIASTEPRDAAAPAMKGETIPAPARQDRVKEPAVDRTPVVVTVGEIQELGGTTSLTQSFVLQHQRDVVWALMSDLEATARCMPGIALDGPPRGEAVSGRLQVKMGPITATFAGEGTVKQHGPYGQIIQGRGSDRGTASRVSGSIDYVLTAVPGSTRSEATRVDVVMSYVLTGPLAQIGRPAIVRDVALRLGTAFAQNIDAQLRAPGSEMKDAQLAGGRFLLQLLGDRVRALFSRLFRRKP
jgi:carbon-monoxide dehydrogenase small subunit